VIGYYPQSEIKKKEKKRKEKDAESELDNPVLEICVFIAHSGFLISPPFYLHFSSQLSC